MVCGRLVVVNDLKRRVGMVFDSARSSITMQREPLYGQRLKAQYRVRRQDKAMDCRDFACDGHSASSPKSAKAMRANRD